MLLVTVVAGLLVLGLVGALVVPMLLPEPTLSRDRLDEVFDPPVKRVMNDDRKQDESGTSGSAWDPDDCFDNLSQVLSTTPQARPIISPVMPAAQGYILWYATPAEAQSVYASANQIASNGRTGQIRESEAQSQEIPRYQSYVIDIQGHDAHLLITQYGNTVTVLNSMDVRTDLPAAIKKRIDELT